MEEEINNEEDTTGDATELLAADEGTTSNEAEAAMLEFMSWLSEDSGALVKPSPPASFSPSSSPASSTIATIAVPSTSATIAAPSTCAASPALRMRFVGDAEVEEMREVREEGRCRERCRERVPLYSDPGLPQGWARQVSQAEN